MKNTSLDLSKILPSDIFKILDDVVRAALDLDIPIFVIGATARDLIMQGMYNIPVPTATDDMDFGAAVSTWDEYDWLKSRLIGDLRFTQDSKQEQRLWRDGFKIDVVPYGGLESADGEIAFPPDGDFRMNTAGFGEAFATALRIPIKENEVRIASLAGIVLLKFIAYNDRPGERGRDLTDILFIAKNYLDAGANEKLYERDSDLLADDGFDYSLAGARVLGRDLAAMMSANTKQIVFEVLIKLHDRYDGSETSGALLKEIVKGIKEHR